jgi:hypothetical protein
MLKTNVHKIPTTANNLIKVLTSVIECFLTGAMSPLAESTDPCRCMKEPAKYSLRLKRRPEVVGSGEDARALSFESVETVRVRSENKGISSGRSLKIDLRPKRGGFHNTSVL